MYRLLNSITPGLLEDVVIGMVQLLPEAVHDAMYDFNADVMFILSVPVNVPVLVYTDVPSTFCVMFAVAVLLYVLKQEFGIAVTLDIVPLPGEGQEVWYVICPLDMGTPDEDDRHLLGVDEL